MSAVEPPAGHRDITNDPRRPKRKRPTPPTKRQLSYIQTLADQLGEQPPEVTTRKQATTAIRCLRVKLGLPADESPKGQRRAQPIIVTRADGSTDVVGPQAFRRKRKSRTTGAGPAP